MKIDGLLSVAISITTVFRTFISPIFNFHRRETKLIARQVKLQIGKSTLTKHNIRGWNAESGGKRTPFHPILPS